MKASDFEKGLEQTFNNLELEETKVNKVVKDPYRKVKLGEVETSYILSHELPPNYEDLVKKFGVSWDKGVTVTYGKTIYSKDPIPLDLLAHELVHVRQQSVIGAKIWWWQYRNSKVFRLNQEIPAYRAQYDYVKKHYKKQLHFNYLKFFATVLSSKQYDLGISLIEAMELIKNRQ